LGKEKGGTSTATPWTQNKHAELERRLGIGTEAKRKRVVSGMRPTGRLHIGHYFGALQNWVRLQSDPTYECFYFIADWHALTSDYADTSALAQNAVEIATDYLAAGLDPVKCVIFQQSLVPEQAELHLLLSMVTPLGWLERVPTYKEQLENIAHKDLLMYGFLGYPCLQAADIVMYGNQGVPLYVPVGEDQVSHVELSREIVRRFNMFYFGLRSNAVLQKESEAFGQTLKRLLSQPFQSRWEKTFSLSRARELEQNIRRYVGAQPGQLDPRVRTQVISDFGSLVKLISQSVGVENFFSEEPEFARFVDRSLLTEPQVMLTETPRIPGLDGRKMSKSYGNAITLSETNEEIRKKTKVMVTDPARKRRTDPGNPDVCPVYDWHKLFSPPPTLEWAAQGCRTAGIGCIECKAKMADHLIEWLDREGIRERRLYYEKRKKEVRNIIQQGSVKARLIAQETMSRVRDAVFGKQRIRRGNIR
jgi:tryptophanyl-tRNA synthetase